MSKYIYNPCSIYVTIRGGKCDWEYFWKINCN